MGEPQPYDPEQRPGPPAEAPPVTRADWLVGAEDGMSAEVGRAEAGTPLPFERPKLVRREPSEEDRARLMPKGFEPGRVVILGNPAAAPFPETERDVPAPRTERAPLPPPPPPQPDLPKWDAGQSSVPMLPREEPDFLPSPSIPEVSRDFPMDDAEERAIASAQMAEERAAEEAVAARPHTVVSPKEFELPAAAPPWWKDLPGLLVADRRVQLAGLGLVLVLAVMTFWPRGERTISVARLTSEPERYADTQVRVRGRISEVFPVGGSWAYTLIQGRDTIVVFTRTRRPRRDERVVVTGTLSTGFHDGVSRAAIFESTR